MGFIFSPPKPKVEPLPPLPTSEDPAVKRRKEELRLAQKRRRGRAATILTGGLGDTSMAPVERKTLLGE